MVLLGCAGLLGYGGLAYGYTGLGLGLGNLELFFKYNIQIYNKDLIFQLPILVQLLQV